MNDNTAALIACMQRFKVLLLLFRALQLAEIYKRREKQFCWAHSSGSFECDKIRCATLEHVGKVKKGENLPRRYTFLGTLQDRMRLFANSLGAHKMAKVQLSSRGYSICGEHVCYFPIHTCQKCLYTHYWFNIYR